jgi:hypothetical protein
VQRSSKYSGVKITHLLEVLQIMTVIIVWPIEGRNEIVWERVDRIYSGWEQGPVAGFYEDSNEPPGSVKCWEFLELGKYLFLKKHSARWS